MTHGSEKRARNKHLTIRLTPEERALIEAAADRAGLTAGSYARNVLMGAPTPRQVRRPPVERAELARLLAELGRIGSNVNQIARALNTGFEADGAALYGARADLLAMRNAVLTALGQTP